jgi:hypothetical protein
VDVLLVLALELVLQLGEIRKGGGDGVGTGIGDGVGIGAGGPGLLKGMELVLEWCRGQEVQHEVSKLKCPS